MTALSPKGRCLTILIEDPVDGSVRFHGRQSPVQVLDDFRGFEPLQYFWYPDMVRINRYRHLSKKDTIGINYSDLRKPDARIEAATS